jgi:NitT/TauT family transport system substrate-binding protein
MVKAHKEIIEKMNSDPVEAKLSMNRQLKALINKELSSDVLDKAYNRINLTVEIDIKTLEEFAKLSAEAGYIKLPFDIHNLVNTSFMEE